MFREMLRKRFTRKTTDLEGGYRATSHGHVDDSFNVKRPLLAPRYTRIYHTYNNCSLHDAVQTKFTHKIYSFILVPDVQNLDGATLSPANKCLKKVFRSFYSLGIRDWSYFWPGLGLKISFFLLKIFEPTWFRGFSQYKIKWLFKNSPSCKTGHKYLLPYQFHFSANPGHNSDWSLRIHLLNSVTHPFNQAGHRCFERET